MNFSILDSLLGNLNVNLDLSNHKVTSVQTIINGNVVYNINIHNTDFDGTEEATFKNGYYAVFLTNGQVYFGKLRRITKADRFARLVDVFYLGEIKLEENVQSVTRTANEYEHSTDRQSSPLSINLVKLGNEIHAPTDQMNINIDQILFWEKLQDAGFVVQSILAYHSKNFTH